jgi:iron complex outermembrane receptor protein
MLTGKIYRRVSVAALAIGTWGIQSANAQGAAQPAAVEQVQPPAEEVDQRDRIVVTGSNIATAAEDAPLPVEVYTADDSFKQGGQSALEFTKSLSVVGSTVGETNQFQAGYGNIGAATLNLRGLGGGRTLSIFNGRRFSENINMIPSIALSRTEILKDGGAVIYGADATGGVVNFITRDNFEGMIADAEYKFIDGSDGDYNLALLWGKNFDAANIMVSAEYSHRSELPVMERDWAIREYADNQTPWAPYHTYGTYILRPNAFGAGFAQDVPGLGPTLGVVQDWTADECRASSGPVEGYPAAISGLPVCWWNYMVHTYNLVDEVDQMRLYGQFTFDLDDATRFTAQLSYGKSEANQIGTVASYQANVAAGPTSGTAFQYRVPASNPFFASFLAQNTGQYNPAVVPLISHVDQFLTMAGGPGGNPAWGDGEGTTPTTQLENWNAVAALEGDWGNWAGDWLQTWSTSATFNMATTDSTLPDTIGYRLQEALNGFGGPNCNAPDLVPDNFNVQPVDSNNNGRIDDAETEAWKNAFYATVGTQNPGAAGTNGCLYWNPFSSSYAANASFGQANPRYIAGNENSAELAAWLFDERQEEFVNTALTIDALVSGSTPLELPGGTVAWAAGAQWRQSENRDQVSGDFMNPDESPCQWPGQLPGQAGCPPGGESPYWFFGQNRPNKTDQQQYSYFGEAQVPVFDNLSFQLAVRREEFPQSGLGATVYKVAGKWDPLDWLAIRGSFGTNYQTPPNITPGDISSGLSLIQNAGNKYLRVETENLAGLEPETAEVMNLGVIFNFDSGLPLDGAFRLTLDYFDFQIKDEIKTVSHNQVLNTVFTDTNGDGAPNPGSNNFIDCSAALIGRISFINGVGAAGCTQGTTRGQDVTGIRSVRGNGPGASTSGIDVDASYSFSALGGDITASFSGTNVLEYEVAAFQLSGVTLSPEVDALGFANYSRDGDIVSEWRSNASLNYAVENHNLRYVYRFIQGVKDDRFLGTAFEEIDDFATHNLYYQYNLPWVDELTLSLSVENITDEEPPFTQQQYSYDPFIGNALGRTYEIGLRKTF